MITRYLYSANLQKNDSDLHAAVCTADRNRTTSNLQQKTTAVQKLSTISRKN